MDKVFIDPTYPVYENNALFNAEDPVLNRDGTLLPLIRLKSDLEAKGFTVQTYDQRKKYSEDELRGAGYISLGNMQNLNDIEKFGLRALAFFVFEPPLVLLKPYKVLPLLTRLFEKVFIHNLDGDCYEMNGVNKERLKKMHWPQPYPSVVQEYWDRNERKKAIVIINGHHRPKRMFNKELYSERIRWGIALDKFIPVDLYGRGWDKLLSKSSFWSPYLFNYFAIKKIYKGSCSSKLDVISQYDFSLCFENQLMKGYITEKIFDCLYSGTIPIYWGCEDISKWVPSNCYIDVRNYKNAEVLAKYLKDLGPTQKEHYRQCGRKFLESEEGQRYVFMYKEIFGDQ